MPMHLPCMADQDIEIWGSGLLKNADIFRTILLIVDLLLKFCVIIRFVCV